MENHPRLSIALCTFNGQAHLRQQLESVMHQTYQPFEIIISDDASTDNTVLILKEFAAQHRSIKIYYNQHNIGFNANFEKTLGRCQGEFIAICDQDDLWHPDKLKLQMQAIQNHQMVYHDSELVDQHGLPMGISMSDKFNFYEGGNPAVFLFNNCVSGHSMLFRKSLLLHALPFPKEFFYDQWIAFVATWQGTITTVPQKLVKYRQHHNNATDILAKRKQKKSKFEKIKALVQESKWLGYCSLLTQNSNNHTIQQLFQLSLNRNRSFANLRYSYLIWQNQETMLYLLKKNHVSKFFYTLRKCWGAKAKALF